MIVGALREEVLHVAKDMVVLLDHGHTREAFLLHLCFDGYPLGKALRFRLGMLCSWEFEAIPLPELLSRAAFFDDLCRNMQRVSLRNLLQRYVKQHLLLAGSDDEEIDLDLPAFPSRKGGAPLTPRAAQRLLRNACGTCRISGPLSFRGVQGLGRQLRTAWSDPPLKGEPKEDGACLANLLSACQGPLARMFTSEHDREDASQEVALELLMEQSRRGAMLDDEADADARLALVMCRRVHANFRRRRRVHQELPVGDLSWIPRVSDRRHGEKGDRVCSEEQKRMVSEALKTLSYREREVLKLRCGIGDGYTYTLEEVARIFKFSRERARQVESRALRKVQRPVHARKLGALM